MKGVVGMATSRVTVHFSCPVERVWQTVTDLTNTAWRSDLARVEVLDETHFVEYTKSGYATNFTVTACEPFRRWAFTMENGNMSGSWEGIFEAAEGGGKGVLIALSSCVSIQPHTPLAPAQPCAVGSAVVPAPGRPHRAAARGTDRWPSEWAGCDRADGRCAYGPPW